MRRFRSGWRPGRVAGALALGLAGAAAIAGLTVAVTTVLVARTVVTPPRRRVEDTQVLGFDGETVVLSRSADATVPGDYSFFFGGDRGHARLGEILSHTDSTVTRRVLAIDFGNLARARSGRFTGWFYLSPRDVGVEYSTVEIPTTIGPAPAWLVPGDSAAGDSAHGDWVIQVHGRAVRRSEGLRAVPVFQQEGYTTLLISYRNDGDAPKSADGRYGLGAIEWLDVEAAMRYAIDRGAKRIVLMGWSMGGALVLQALTRSRLAHVVSGVVLESPVVDWVTALTYRAKAMRLPAPIMRGVLGLIGRPWGRRLTGQAEAIDFARLDFVQRADELDVPVLLLHSTDDGFVPETASARLAAARPDIVTFERFHTARHTRLWNYDRERWNRAIRDWLRRLPHAREPLTPPTAPAPGA